MSLLISASVWLAAGVSVPADNADQIIVTGKPLETAPVQSAQQALVPVQIERRGAISLSEALDLASAANVTTNSRGETLVYLRNAGERQLAVLFDGAALNIPWDNRLSLDLVPTQALGGIVVTPGTLSLRYGVNSAGGAIELVPASVGDAGARREVSAMGGSGGLRSVSGLWLGGEGPVSFTAAAERVTRDGLTAPDGDGLQANTDMERTSFLLRAARDGGAAGQISIGLLHLDSAFGIAPARFERPSQGSPRYWRYPESRPSPAMPAGLTRCWRTRRPGATGRRGCACNRRRTSPVARCASPSTRWVRSMTRRKSPSMPPDRRARRIAAGFPTCAPVMPRNFPAAPGRPAISPGSGSTGWTRMKPGGAPQPAVSRRSMPCWV